MGSGSNQSRPAATPQTVHVTRLTTRTDHLPSRQSTRHSKSKRKGELNTVVRRYNHWLGGHVGSELNTSRSIHLLIPTQYDGRLYSYAAGSKQRPRRRTGGASCECECRVHLLGRAILADTPAIAIQTIGTCAVGAITNTCESFEGELSFSYHVRPLLASPDSD